MELDRALLSEGEAQTLDQGMKDLRAVMSESSHRLIRDRIDQLDRLSADFAVRRMNRSMGEALSGRRAEELESG